MEILNRLRIWFTDRMLRFFHSDFKNPPTLFKLWAALAALLLVLFLCGVGSHAPIPEVPTDVRSAAQEMRIHTFETLLQVEPNRIQQVVIYRGVPEVIVYLHGASAPPAASTSTANGQPAPNVVASAPTAAPANQSAPQTVAPANQSGAPQAPAKNDPAHSSDKAPAKPVDGKNYKLPNGVVVFIRNAINAAPLVTGIPQAPIVPVPAQAPPTATRSVHNDPAPATMPLSDPMGAPVGEQPNPQVNQTAPNANDDITKLDPSYFVSYPDKTQLVRELDSAHVHYDYGTAHIDRGLWANLSTWFIIVAVIVGGILLVIVAMAVHKANAGNNTPATLGIGGAAGGSPSNGPNDSGPEGDEVKVTFDMVGGCEEAVEKIRCIAEWLKYRYYYDHFLAELPKGALLEGPTGTGKTWLVRALKTEAGHADLWIRSASEFVEMYVGVGASRIRKVFEEAEARFKKTGRLQIIFIDELDAVGSHRTTGGAGGDKEHNQTINQLLTCIDGFKGSKGIFVVGATNMKKNLDPALLRPGRLSYHIQVAPPDQAGREKIFEIHTKGMKLAPEVSRKEMARRTPNMTGATIKHICNEAAIRAAKRAREIAEAQGLTEEQVKELIKTDKLPRVVTRLDFDAAIDEAQFGDHLESKQRNQPLEDQLITSFHEAAHGVALARKSKGKDLPTKVSRQMRSESLGMMQSHTEQDRYTYRRDYLETRIVCAFAGRLGQTILMGEDFVDTGASNDYEQASRLCRLMCGSWGMSAELGEISIPLDEATGYPRIVLGSKLQNDFDDAWRNMVKRFNDEAREIVEMEIEPIERIANAVFEDETVFTDRFKLLLDGDEKPELTAEVIAVRRKREESAKQLEGRQLL